jgi:uncharacterized SAM-binding protein YcdF (DUF218 family)
MAKRLMAKHRKFGRRRFSPLRFVSELVLLVIAAWAAGLAGFSAAVWSAAPPDPIPRADGIVALTGGDGRVSEAMALLAEKDAPALLISGAGRGTYLGDFTVDDAAAATRYASAITLGHMAATTRGNALETASWAKARHMKSLLIVTADYHMPRAIFVIGQRLPDVELVGVPVRPPAMAHMASLATWRVLAVEYTKYLVARAGLDDFAGADADLTQ